MKLFSQRRWAQITALAVCSMTSPAMFGAEEHLVPLKEIQGSAQAATATREGNLADLQRVLSLPAAQDALAKAHVNNNQVTSAVAQLSDEELAQLATKARAAEQDVQGGLIVGLLALIGLIVVVIIVVSIVA